MCKILCIHGFSEEGVCTFQYTIIGTFDPQVLKITDKDTMDGLEVALGKYFKLSNTVSSRQPDKMTYHIVFVKSENWWTSRTQIGMVSCHAVNSDFLSCLSTCVLFLY